MNSLRALLIYGGLAVYPDLGSFPKPVPAILPLFATLGLVNSNLRPKPALAIWDKVYARPLAR